MYTQALTPINNTREVLKIKEMFPNLQTKKSKKIINDEEKPKPKLNMTIKGPLRKQVIVSISNNNKTKFIKDSIIHIANINRAFKNIKSEVMADLM